MKIFETVSDIMKFGDLSHKTHRLPQTIVFCWPVTPGRSAADVDCWSGEYALHRRERRWSRSKLHLHLNNQINTKVFQRWICSQIWSLEFPVCWTPPTLSIMWLSCRTPSWAPSSAPSSPTWGLRLLDIFSVSQLYRYNSISNILPSYFLKYFHPALT